MTLSNIKTLKSERGFTIVELLIVIVVIAILAAITIVAYNGIQNRAKTTSGKELASQIAKKAEAYHTVDSTYPTFAELTATDSAVPEAQLDNPAAVKDASTSANADAVDDFEDGSAVGYLVCSSGGAKITYWDFTAAAGSEIQTMKVGDTTTCTAV